MGLCHAEGVSAPRAERGMLPTRWCVPRRAQVDEIWKTMDQMADMHADFEEIQVRFRLRAVELRAEGQGWARWGLEASPMAPTKAT